MVLSARIRLLPVALAATALAFSLTPASASARLKECKKQAHTIAKRHGNLVFRRGQSLWACTSQYGDPPRTVRLGRWATTSKLSWDGSTAIWTLPSDVVAPDGTREDRLWAVYAPGESAILTGARPYLSVTAEPLDGKVVGVRSHGFGVAWVTAGGLVGAAMSMERSDPGAIGVGTPAAVVPSIGGVAQGLAVPLTPAGGLLLGRWSADPAALAKSLQVNATYSDGDNCAGYTEYEITVQPIASEARVGATWASDWLSSNSECGG